MDRPNPIAPEAPVQPLSAPLRLTSHHRLDFRRAVLEALETAATAGAHTVDVDLSRTIEMDASGLGVLVLLQKRARERGLRTRLVSTPHAVREMLLMTRLDALFEFVTEA
jgi:anti-anti-sigma factor